MIKFVAVFVVAWFWLAAVGLALVDELFRYNTGSWFYAPAQVTAAFVAAGVAWVVVRGLLWAWLALALRLSLYPFNSQPQQDQRPQHGLHERTEKPRRP